MQRHLLALFLLFTTLAGSVASAQEWSATPTWTDELSEARPTLPPDWVTEKGTYLRVHGHPDDQATLLRLARHGADRLPELSERLGVPIGHTIHVYVADSQARFRELQPGRAPTWADGVAYPALGTIVLRAPDVRGGTAAPLEQVFDHELVHVLLGRAFAPAVPPSWLQEGAAQLLAGEVGPQVARDIASGMATGGLIDLDDLGHGFPSDAMRARLAYAQSADFVAWLEQTYGEGVLTDLVTHSRQGDPLAAAVRRSTGDSLAAVERQWRSQYTTGIGFSWTAVMNEGVLFGIGGIVLAIGGVQRKRRFRQRMEELAREEALVDQLLAQMGRARPQPWT
jgi:hypothetical protein